MDLLTIARKYPTHSACLEQIERIRWGSKPACPYCRSADVARKVDGERLGRWNCHTCHSSFNALAGTVFQKTRVPLQKWFLAIAIVMNAKKSVSSHQLARDLDLTQATAWFLNMRLRRAMLTEAPLLTGIVEADEAYIGGRPFNQHRRNPDGTWQKSKRGRGTEKLPIIGIALRGSTVIAQPSEHTDSRTMERFLLPHISTSARLMTDHYWGYKRMGRYLWHSAIDHRKHYVEGEVHTNTIEGFWAGLKRAWHGTHHHYSRKHAAAYVTEACYKYNMRGHPDPFGALLNQAVTTA